MKLLKIRKKKACWIKNSIILRMDICLCHMLSIKPAKTYSNTKAIPGEGNIKNFQVEGKLQDQSKCLLMVRCVWLNITGIFHV